MRIIYFISFIFIFGVSCSTTSSSEFAVKENYTVENPDTPQEIKNAIYAHKVIIGMCPNEVIAAAGKPFQYIIQKDVKWGQEKDVIEIILAQCQSPDNSLIKFTYHGNRVQFSPDVDIPFIVYFEKGIVVKIERV